jgi:hypothetical protein
MTQGNSITVGLAIAVKSLCTPRWPALLLAILLWAPPSQSIAASLYKWVDENGAVHYSSNLPPEQNQKRHQQLNSQGMVLSTTEAAKTPEELAKEAEQRRELEQRQAEEARLKSIQDGKDRVLLLTFSTEAELEHARENRIEVIDSVIRLIKSSIATTQDKLEELKSSAEVLYTSKGKDIPGGMAQKIEHAERKVASRRLQLEAKTAEREKIWEKYELDLERYRLLKADSK